MSYLIATGLSNAEIAAQLFLAVGTVARCGRRAVRGRPIGVDADVSV
ncbi:hypothetical protein [Embleya scabrispora]